MNRLAGESDRAPSASGSARVPRAGFGVPAESFPKTRRASASSSGCARRDAGHRTRGRARSPELAATLLLALAIATATAAAADTPWIVKNAPIRAIITLKEAPQDADSGAEITVPDFGLVEQGGGDYTLTDSAGQPVPVSAVWQGEGRDAILLARGLGSGQTYYLYIGGPAGATWSPKTSLFLETRRSNASRGESFTSAGALQSAWGGAARQTQGAEFVPNIFAGENPFGAPELYYSHYSGYLAPTASEMELFTNSTDSSFVLLNDQLFVDWTGKPNGNMNEKGLVSKKLPPSAEPIKLDYYQAKGGGADPPNMTLGWRKPGGPLEIVPQTAFLHPGETAVERYEAQDGAPVPAPEIHAKSYIGYGGAYLYEVRCKLGPADLRGATVEWHFDDGAILMGTDVTRVMSGAPDTQTVTVVARRGAASMRVVRRITFAGKPPPEASAGEEEGKKGERGHDRYVELLSKLDPTRLDAAMLAAALPLLFDGGTDALIATYANPWLALQPRLPDPLWLPAFGARVRTIAQTNPKAAVAEVAAQTAARQFYGDELNRLELELLVFSVHDLAGMPRAQQLAFNLGADSGKLGDIRVGDLYRLNGDAKQAFARYEAAQPPDPSNGRQLPAEDQANSMTVEDLIDNGTREEASARLASWELAHPMAKYTTNFLVLRARVLAMYGRWREALTELDAFAASHPDSPYEIDVNYYRARALYELGDKDQARKIWRQIARDYPKSELAAPSLTWAEKP